MQRLRKRSASFSTMIGSRCPIARRSACDVVAIKGLESVARIMSKDKDDIIIEQVKVIRNLTADLNLWKRLYLDQPEDRLFHEKDQTWWRRRDDTYLGAGALFKAAPPEYVQKLEAQNKKLKAQVKRLKNKKG